MLSSDTFLQNFHELPHSNKQLQSFFFVSFLELSSALDIEGVSRMSILEALVWYQIRRLTKHE